MAVKTWQPGSGPIRTGPDPFPGVLRKDKPPSRTSLESLSPFIRRYGEIPPRNRRVPFLNEEAAAATEGEATLVIRSQVKLEVATLGSMGFTVIDNEELFRDTYVKRVENPEDPEQYVDVEVIERIGFRLGDGQKAIFKLNNPPEEEE
jgi:hypothetical protein